MIGAGDENRTRTVSLGISEDLERMSVLDTVTGGQADRWCPLATALGLGYWPISGSFDLGFVEFAPCPSPSLIALRAAGEKAGCPAVADLPVVARTLGGPLSCLLGSARERLAGRAVAGCSRL